MEDKLNYDEYIFFMEMILNRIERTKQREKVTSLSALFRTMEKCLKGKHKLPSEKTQRAYIDAYLEELNNNEDTAFTALKNNWKSIRNLNSISDIILENCATEEDIPKIIVNSRIINECTVDSTQANCEAITYYSMLFVPEGREAETLSLLNEIYSKEIKGAVIGIKCAFIYFYNAEDQRKIIQRIESKTANKLDIFKNLDKVDNFYAKKRKKPITSADDNSGKKQKK